MSDTKLPIEISLWQKKLELQNYRIVCQRISMHQVCDDNNKRGHEFVEICADHIDYSACLYHTRKLTTCDVVHELLHVKYPFWSEQQINDETDRILNAKEVNNFEIL